MSRCRRGTFFWRWREGRGCIIEGENNGTISRRPPVMPRKAHMAQEPDCSKQLLTHFLLRRFGKHSSNYKMRIPRCVEKMPVCVSNCKPRKTGSTKRRSTSVNRRRGGRWCTCSLAPRSTMPARAVSPNTPCMSCKNSPRPLAFLTVQGVGLLIP
jgi:hypothetical protein